MTRLLSREPIEPAELGSWLRELAEQVEGRRSTQVEGVGLVPSETLRQALREHLRARRARDALFGAGLFADPAWDLLLDLLLCDLEQRKVSIGSACLAAAVPPTTALRWIGQLEARELVRRRADPSDGRRAHVVLTGFARDALLKWVHRHLPVARAEATGTSAIQGSD